MPISSIVDGKVLDWSWKRREVDTLFYIGDQYIGQIFNMGKQQGWTALHRLPNNIGLADGFKTRYDASHFLLKFEPNIQY